MIEKLSARVLANYGKPSKVEDRVANWLTVHQIEHERQPVLVRYSIDFRVGDAYIEVQGCYWHGCPQHYAEHTPRQKKQVSRDKAKATYCRNRNITLFIIWEHDIMNGNFSALNSLIPAHHSQIE